MKKNVSLVEQVKGYILYWQPKLRLTDWRVSFKITTDHKEIGCFGRNAQDPNFQVSMIELLDPASIPEDWRGCRDLEVTTVHELLHTRLLYVAPVPNKKKKKKQWQVEMAVETLAKALVAARRGVDPEDIK